MQKVRVVVWGGCHVVGYPLGPAHAFPAKLGQLLEAEVVGQVATLSFLRMPAQLASLRQLRPTHVVLQLGNYEFSASFRNGLRLFKNAFRPEGAKGKPAASGSGSGSSRSVVSHSTDAPPVMNRLARYGRIGSLGPLIAATWLLSRRYRQAFEALNAYVAQHPGTAFVVLAPLPCLDPASNALRRLGGRLLRHGLRHQPNLSWLGTHEVIARDARFFADWWHLNQAGHHALAQRLAGAMRPRVPARLDPPGAAAAPGGFTHLETRGTP